MNDAATVLDTTPRAAYVHVPFCRHRCGYCNFTLVAGRLDLIPSYLEAIAREIGEDPPSPVDTLYFGGGTPTQLPSDSFRELAAMVLRRHPLLPGHEWTVEANPADVDAAYLDMLCTLGVTRLSLGGQSFRAEKLALLERDHMPRTVEQVVDLARERGLHVALDLIFATPGETVAQWEDDLQQALVLNVEHLSTYGLTFEKGTQFWNRQQRDELRALDESVERAMYELAIDRLTGAGFEHYEVSNFARPSHRSRHNQVYWSGHGYWAYGPGAARFVPPVRETNHRSTTTWIKRLKSGESPVDLQESLTPEQLSRERLVFGLRQLAGIDIVEFESSTAFSVEQLAGHAVRGFQELGLLEIVDGNLRLTRDGLMVSDAIWPDLL